MSDKMRWRYEDTNPVVAAVDSDTVIEIGDLLWQDTDDAKPASMCTSEDQGAAEVKFKDNFLGVAMQRSRSGDTAPIRVAATGVFEFDCPSCTFESGDPVCPMAIKEGLQNQQVAKAALATCAIGRIAKRQAVAITSILINIRSTVMTGGV